MERGFSRIWRILKAWNADFRGFGGFSRILSGAFIKIRVIKNLRNPCFASFE
ncbi:MAG: hypothetical protein FWG87_03085 [Defluviitaleaceae bacterium]|nr:hypothetical protein [Defluviitaleaceae bacterium]